MESDEQKLDNLNRFIDGLLAELDYAKQFLLELYRSKDVSEYEATLERFNRYRVVNAIEMVPLEFNLTENLVIIHNHLITGIFKRLKDQPLYSAKKEEIEFILDQIPKNSWLPSPSVPSQDELRNKKFQAKLEEFKESHPESYQEKALLWETIRNFKPELSEMLDTIDKNRHILADTIDEVSDLTKKVYEFADSLGVLE